MAYRGIYVIWGPPGTGKTRFCANQVKKICQTIPRVTEEAAPVAVCSLTRAAAREIAGRDLPLPEWQVGTLHSMAYRQIGSPPVAEAEAKEFNSDHNEYAISADNDIDDSTGDQLTSNPDAPGNALYQQYSLYRAQMYPREKWPPDVAYFAKLWEEWKNTNGLVDFSDMIDLAMVQGKGHAPGNPPVIVVDEAQDISIQEWQLLRVWYEAANAMIVAGDPYQTLYSWRGADASIFFDEAIPISHRKLLHHSHRVPRLVRDLSLQWLRENLSNFIEIKYDSKPEDGMLGVFDSNYSSPDEVIDWVKDVLSTSDTETVMINGTCGYMLKETVNALRKEGIPFANPWRRKRGDWNPLKPTGRGKATHFLLMSLYQMLTGQHPMTWSDFSGVMTIFRVEGTLKRGVKSFLKQMSGEAGKSNVSMFDVENSFLPEAWVGLKGSVENDRTGRDFCSWVSDHAGGQRVSPLQYAADVVASYGFDALVKPPRVFVGTMHSFKGAQADHVVMYPDLSQAGDRAVNAMSQADDEDRDSVIRTFYVGMTRAIRSLTLCQPKSRLAVDIPLDTV
jgi:superfamily I DNA/RNA helicase